jgi:hypothetical protein
MNSRSAQVVAALLAFLLIVFIGATIFILLSRPTTNRPTPSPTGTSVAVISPSGSALPSPSASASPTLTPGLSATPSLPPTVPPTVPPTDTPSLEPTITVPPTPSPSPSPTPTPSPTLPPPTSPQREFRLSDVGLDRRSESSPVQRTVAFVVDGPSLITAELSNVSAGRVRMCLGRNAIDPQNDCQNMRNGSISRAVFDSGESDWRVTLIGVSADVSPFVTLTLSFNATIANVHLDSFRFNGTTDAHYNGFIARLAAVDSGDLSIQATFDDGHDNPYQYTLVLTRLSDNAVDDRSGGPSGSLNESFPVTTGETYRVELSEPEEFAGGGAFAVFVDATLTWP